MTSQAHFGFEDAAEETLYKLTDAEGVTGKYYGTPLQWGEGVTHTVSGGGEICQAGWIHAYTDPILAVLFNPLHAQIEKPILWKCTGIVGFKNCENAMVGCTSLTTLRKIPMPHVSLDQRIRFGILCAKQVVREESWNRWADRWLDGSAQDFEAEAVKTVASAQVPARAAFAASYVAYAASSSKTVWAAMMAAKAVRYAAQAAQDTASPLDLCALARQALETP